MNESPCCHGRTKRSSAASLSSRRGALRTLSQARLAHALPGLAAAEHAAEGAALHAERVRTLHRDRRVVVPAAVGIVDLAGPFGLLWTHVDQDLLAGLDGVAAQVLAARFDAHVAFVLFGGPDAERSD